MSTPYRMSQRLREQLEWIAGMCNNGESHVAGDALERLLGYEVDEQGLRKQSENCEDEPPLSVSTCKRCGASCFGFLCAECLR